MDAGLLLIPALLGAGAIGTGLARRHQAKKLDHLLDARSSSVAELLDLQATVAAQMGAGSFRERVKLSGEIVCDEPLTAPWSGEPCVAFTNTTTALLEVREERTSTDSEGNSRTSVSWERREETLEALERRCSFALRHGNQRLTLDPTGAELELETVFSDLEPATSPSTHNTRPLGTRREEAILHPNGMVFVVAECSDSDGTLQLHAPKDAGLFVVRRGSEESFSSSIRRWRRIWMLSTWCLLGLAALMLIACL
jgi:hypothetical protein